MKKFFENPYFCLALGLVAVPIAKILYIPNYIFNFLTTLVHEIGHSACAWVMGMPSIPSVSVTGGGVTIWQDQMLILCIAIMAGLGALAYFNREKKWLAILFIIILTIYPLFAFTNGKLVLALFGGMLFEIIGATICFIVCLCAPLQRPFERPLYALWGWWMLINRCSEAFLMLTNKEFRNATRVIESGLAAGLPHDITQITDLLNISSELVLITVLLLGVLSVPFSTLCFFLKSKNIQNN